MKNYRFTVVIEKDEDGFLPIVLNYKAAIRKVTPGRRLWRTLRTL